MASPGVFPLEAMALIKASRAGNGDFSIKQVVEGSLVQALISNFSIRSECCWTWISLVICYRENLRSQTLIVSLYQRERERATCNQMKSNENPEEKDNAKEKHTSVSKCKAFTQSKSILQIRSLPESTSKLQIKEAINTSSSLCHKYCKTLLF